jgi:hypothetical protein
MRYLGWFIGLMIAIVFNLVILKNIITDLVLLGVLSFLSGMIFSGIGMIIGDKLSKNKSCC